MKPLNDREGSIIKSWYEYNPNCTCGCCRGLPDKDKKYFCKKTRRLGNKDIIRKEMENINE